MYLVTLHHCWITENLFSFCFTSLVILCLNALLLNVSLTRPQICWSITPRIWCSQWRRPSEKLKQPQSRSAQIQDAPFAGCVRLPGTNKQTWSLKRVTLLTYIPPTAHTSRHVYSSRVNMSTSSKRELMVMFFYLEPLDLVQSRFNLLEFSFTLQFSVSVTVVSPTCGPIRDRF